jgi:hypothetical protein
MWHMKRIFKILIFTGAIIFIIALTFFTIMFFKAREYSDQLNSTIHVCIEFKEEIQDLKTVELHMCKEVNSFSEQYIKDTVLKTIAVPYKEFPCETRFRYFFENGSSKEIAIGEFNCAGCSGTHVYTLGMDSVRYTYMP